MTRNRNGRPDIETARITNYEKMYSKYEWGRLFNTALIEQKIPFDPMELYRSMVPMNVIKAVETLNKMYGYSYADTHRMDAWENGQEFRVWYVPDEGLWQKDEPHICIRFRQLNLRGMPDPVGIKLTPESPMFEEVKDWFEEQRAVNLANKLAKDAMNNAMKLFNTWNELVFCVPEFKECLAKHRHKYLTGATYSSKRKNVIAWREYYDEEIQKAVKETIARALLYKAADMDHGVGTSETYAITVRTPGGSPWRKQ